MPLREWDHQGDRIYRQFRYGNLADLIMLDTRHYARDLQSAVKPVSPSAGFPANDPVINDPARTLLGFDQEAWLAQRLHDAQSAGVQWKLLGQQVMMAQLSVSGGQTLFNLDQWDGYRPARQRLLDGVRDNGIGNLVVLTGDIHTSWANEITANPWNPAGYDPLTGRGSLGVEFVTPAVTSPGIVDPVEAAQTAAFLRSASPHMKYIELNKRGYVVLDIDRERTQGEFWHVPTVASRTDVELLAAALVTESGTNRLVPAASASAVHHERDPAA